MIEHVLRGLNKSGRPMNLTECIVDLRPEGISASDFQDLLDEMVEYGLLRKQEMEIGTIVVNGRPYSQKDFKYTISIKGMEHFDSIIKSKPYLG